MKLKPITAVTKYFWALGLLAAVIAHPQLSWSKEEIEFPEEDVAQETVLPKFNSPLVVMSRAITTEKKIELGAYLGWNFTEPIFAQNKFGLNFSYHWSEMSAINVNFSKWASGLNKQYTDQLYDSYKLDFSRAPAPDYSMWVNYELKAYYGKMSFAKDSVSHLIFYPLFGLGLNKYQNKSYYGLDGGVGGKFFFNKSWALRTDLKLQYFQYPSPFLTGKMKTTSATTPSGSDFEDKWTYATIFDVGIAYLF